MKKILALVLALVMVLMVAAASAQTVAMDPADSDNASITINNAAKGETYSVFKLFDATIGTGTIAYQYTGDIPEGLTTYFEKDSANNVKVLDAAKDATDATALSASAISALKTWASSQSAVISAVSDGSALTFSGLPYGYYVVTSTQDGGAAISVDSTNPNASINDKNSTQPKELTKSVDDDDVFIGQTVTYTVTFKTSNYDGGDSSAKQIKTYTIKDTLPAFLTNVTVTSIIVDDDADLTTTSDQHDVTAQFVNKAIDIAWVSGTSPNFTSLYKNGALVKIVYTATVTDQATIGSTGNTNTVTLGWTDVDDTNKPDQLTQTETIYTYAIALKKVNQSGTALADATFQLPFLVTGSGPVYTYNGTGTSTVTTTDNGEITIKGVASGDYSITETVAPNGYNKLTAAFTVSAVTTSESTTVITTYLDANGEITDQTTETTVTYTPDSAVPIAGFKTVVNKTGTTLPSTGGIGTTIFYIVGGLLVIGAAVILVARRKSHE